MITPFFKFENLVRLGDKTYLRVRYPNGLIVRYKMLSNHDYRIFDEEANEIPDWLERGAYYRGALNQKHYIIGLQRNNQL